MKTTSSAAAMQEWLLTRGPAADPASFLTLGRLSHAGSRPVSLSAAKSALGHTETAAGAVGILQAAGRLAASTHPEMLHLRSLNPYVASTFAANAKGNSAWAARRSSGSVDRSGGGSGGNSGSFALHCGFTAARQPQPMVAPLPATDSVGPAGSSGAVGISAFAFQGTNAHVLLAAAEPDASLLVGGATSASLVSTLWGVRSSTEEIAHTQVIWQLRSFQMKFCQCK